MRSRAAVAWEANKPLTIETIDIDGPKSGEVLVEVMATGVCHTDAYTLSGLDSEGKFPAILGHEGAGIVRELGAGRDFAESRRSRHSALHTRMPAMQNVPVTPLQSLHIDPRHPGPRPDAGQHLALLVFGKRSLPLHGLLDVLELHRAAGDRPRQGARGRAVRQDLLHRLRRHHRHRRRGLHARKSGPARMSSSSAWAASASM